jgi:hypothetical protein
LHQYRLGGELTKAVWFDNAEVHAGSPCTVLLWSSTLYTPFAGSGGAGAAACSLLHPAATVATSPPHAVVNAPAARSRKGGT